MSKTPLAYRLGNWIMDSRLPFGYSLGGFIKYRLTPDKFWDEL